MNLKARWLTASLACLFALGTSLPILAEDDDNDGRRVRREGKGRDFKKKKRTRDSKCKHEWKKLRVEMNPEQKRNIAAFKKDLNEQTRGYNHVVLRGILGEVDYILEQARREKQENPDIARLRELAKQVKAKIKWAHEELEDYRVSLMSPAQKKKHYLLLAAKQDHRKNCPHPPRSKERKLRLADVESYKQYGVFDCPPFGKQRRKNNKEDA
ncbi:MAG: hypothetical protein QF752_06940 [Planctomycetota bacterium]|nr:hypothetical protein [Planctomycetota bacterium]